MVELKAFNFQALQELASHIDEVAHDKKHVAVVYWTEYCRHLISYSKYLIQIRVSYVKKYNQYNKTYTKHQYSPRQTQKFPHLWQNCIGWGIERIYRYFNFFELEQDSGKHKYNWLQDYKFNCKGDESVKYVAIMITMLTLW